LSTSAAAAERRDHLERVARERVDGVTAAVDYEQQALLRIA